MVTWDCLLRLDADREIVSGSREALAAAVRRGADLRCYSSFDYAEHMAVPGSDVGPVEEMMNFGVAYWLAGDRTAGIQTTRYPANCSLGFGDNPSLSFFLNNDDGHNGIARPFLDGRTGATKQTGYQSPKYVVHDHWDDETACPSENFSYRFNEYAWWVRDDWQEVLAHEADGTVVRGSLEALRDAFRAGANLKVGVRRLCAGLCCEGQSPVDHELFVEMGPIYNHADGGFLGGESQPVVRVAPGVPLRYASGNWNYGWLLPRTDGAVHQLVANPYTHEFIRRADRFPVRWFAR